MKCCKPNRNLFNPLAIPPDFNPPTGGQYLYTMFVAGNNYDIFNDTYDSLTIDGVTYSAGGGSLLSTSNGGDTITPLLVDATDAGIVNATNDVGYYGDDSPNFTTSNYLFIFLTDSPKVIEINLTLNGNPTTFTVLGGALVMQNYCATSNAVDVSGCNVTFKQKAEDGVYYQLPNPTILGYLFSDTLSILSYINAYFNTLNNLIPYAVSYSNNGNGTYTQTITAPNNFLYPYQVTGLDIGVLLYTPC